METGNGGVLGEGIPAVLGLITIKNDVIISWPIFFCLLHFSAGSQN